MSESRGTPPPLDGIAPATVQGGGPSTVQYAELSPRLELGVPARVEPESSNSLLSDFLVHSLKAPTSYVQAHNLST